MQSDPKVARTHIIRAHDITYEDYLTMRKNQNELCLICGIKPDELHCDHDHATGKIRGLLCARCNMAIGLFKDNPVFLRSAIEYLERNKID
jgi:hypothetical protein